MEANKKKSINYYFRTLHRDVGFFLIGITIIFSLSGIVLIYRDTSFLKKSVTIEKQLRAELMASQLGDELKMRRFAATSETADTIYFENGTYAKKTGEVKYTEMQLPGWINKMNGFHKSSSKSALHWFTTVYGILLFFMAISSFWMFKTSTKQFKRGMVLSVLGIIAAVIFLVV